MRDLLDILKEQEQHLKIIEVCRKAIVHEPKNEKIHICLMEQLLTLGQVNDETGRRRKPLILT